MMELAPKGNIQQRNMYIAILMTSFTNILILGITTVTSIITSRMFGAEGKGELAAILFWPGFLTNLATLGLPTALIYHIKKNNKQIPVFTGIGFLLQIPVSIVVGVISWFGVSSWLSNYAESVISISRVYIASLTPVLLIMGVFAATAQGMEKFQIYNLARLLAPFINLIGLVSLWITGTLSLERTIIVSFVSFVCVVVFYAYSLREHISRQVFSVFHQMKSGLYLLSYAARVSGVELLNTLYNQSDKIIILALLTPREFGLYSVVYALSRMFNVFQTAITNVIFPRATGLEEDKVFSLVGRSFRTNMVFMMIIIVPSMVVGRFLLGLLYGQEFLEASGAFYLLSIECVVGGGAGILASSFNALGRPGVILVGQSAGVAVSISLFLLLTPHFGLYGIGLSLLTGSIVRVMVSLISLKKIYKIPIRQMLYNKGDIQFVMQRLNEKLILKRSR
ncbi:lipopolysaccharide biosynthesis protein [Paenibacillus sp. NPDC057886]|uniref:lipopolysaccharide biosynthesis protein n=1 Tax=Paenibacillus sp. NPDC057886 TaxID=3346270 RepID=UPI003696C6BB